MGGIELVHWLQYFFYLLEVKEVGFTLAEIRKLLSGWFDSAHSKSETLELFETKIVEIDNKIRQFRQIKKRLEKVCKELRDDACEP